MFCVILVVCGIMLPFQWVQIVTHCSCGVHIGVHKLIFLYLISIVPTVTVVFLSRGLVGTIGSLGRFLMSH